MVPLSLYWLVSKALLLFASDLIAKNSFSSGVKSTMDSNVKRVLVMAGGTGGHVFPALAIVKQMQARGHVVEWLGTRGRLEEKVVPENGITIHYIDVQGVRRNGIFSLLKAPFKIIHAIAQARSVLKTFKPDVVIGFGGYASGPGGMAAYLSGIPLILHEQNAAAGMTNRILSRFATKILLGVGKAFSGSKVESVGNPLRSEILELAQETKVFSHEDGKVHILIVGGSLGAAALNQIVPEALCKVGQTTAIEVFHQCGKGNAQSTSERYANATFEVQTSDFVNDMASAYRKADLIICRAGASTISEVCAAKVPAIFVPLPTAVDDHQTKNAMSLVEVNAARLLPQSQLTADSLAALVKEIANPETLAAMSQATANCAKLDATSRVCDIAEQVAK